MPLAGLVDHHVGHRARQLLGLENGAAAQEQCKHGLINFGLDLAG